MSNYPNDFNCPITLKIFNDPVICDDGITYERDAILNWFNQPASKSDYEPDKRVSPVTKKLISTNLIANRALKNSIEEYLKNNPNLELDFIHDKNDEKKNVDKFEEILNAAIQPLRNNHVDEENIKIECNGIEAKGNQIDLYLSIVPPNKGPKRDTVYINVVDVSGSMQLPAMEKTEGDFEYSRLDLVKFSLENIVENCEENDYFALIIFSNNVEVILPITKMTKENKKLAKIKIYEQDTQGATNLWGGMLAGLDLIKTNEYLCKNKNVSMIVLTDGESNQNPPRGVFKTLENYLDKNKISCSINTFGFGYDIDSNLLFEIALKLGNGAFGFIPDCTMIGTNVTSLIAKNKSCFVKDVELKIKIEGNAKWIPNYNDLLNIDTSLYTNNTVEQSKEAEIVLKFGSIDYGQKRDILIRLDNVAIATAIDTELNYNKCSENIKKENKRFILYNELNHKNEEIINELHDRNLFINGLFDLIKIRINNNKDENYKNKAINKLIDDLINKFEKTNNEKFIRELKPIKHEREGQIGKAFSKQDWFKKWGLSHSLYLISSHLRRFNANFKDPSIQSYGGEIFENHRNDCENIFCTLQQPKPSIRQRANNNNNNNNFNYNYNKKQITIAQACCNVDAGCFTGDCDIKLSNGKIKKINELIAGDELESWNGLTCKIKCILKTKCLKPVKLVNINGLKITPYHPVFINEWKFPLDIGKLELIDCGYVYNLVVDKEHVVIINGIKCVTLGHGFTHNQVISHPYFGTDKIINDLKNMKGWSNGLIIFECMLNTRDKSTGLINKIFQNEYDFPIHIKENNFSKSIKAY